MKEAAMRGAVIPAALFVALISVASRPLVAADEMPGKCNEGSVPMQGGGWYHYHEFGTDGAPYTCGTNGCHTEEAETLCHQHDHAAAS